MHEIEALVKQIALAIRGNSIYLSEVDISSITSALLDPNNVLQNLDLPYAFSLRDVD